MDSFDNTDYEVVIILVGLVLVMYIPRIFFLVTCQKLIQRINPECQTMPPARVWLHMIPLFCIVWRFVMVQNISNMLSMQYHGQILEPASQRPTQQLGMWYSGLFVARFIPVAGGIVGLAGLVIWIMYWSKLHEYYQKLPSQEKEEYALDAGRYMKD